MKERKGQLWVADALNHFYAKKQLADQSLFSCAQARGFTRGPVIALKRRTGNRVSRESQEGRRLEK